MENNELLQNLQAIVTGLAQQADGHDLESIIFAKKGFTKLSQHYKDHAVEERGYVDQIANRIVDLGGKLENQAKQAAPTYEDPIDWIKYDRQVSIDGLAYLKTVIDMAKDDFNTTQILEAYYNDEDDDLVWANQQLNLIDTIGKQYWYFTQI